MKSFTYLEIEQIDSALSVKLNRPERRNALNAELISELLSAYSALKDDPSVEFVVLSGKGKAFCAGADLEWMKSAAQASYEENLKGSKQLAELFNTVYTFPKVTLAKVHGSVFGGAIGLMAAHDFVIASNESKFAFSEVKLGLIPATIAPYIIKRIGQYQSLDLMLTGRLFTAEEAEAFGLVNKCVRTPELDNAVQELLDLLRLTGPKARMSCKELIRNISGEVIDSGLMDYTAEEIAKHRASKEGREGMHAFFEKRKPNWIQE